MAQVSPPRGGGVSPRLRFEVLRRDNWRCHYCGARSADVALQVDHVVPRSLGGSDEPTNLVASCEPCNGGKNSSLLDDPPVDDVSTRALRWAEAIRHAADERFIERLRIDDLVNRFDELWREWASDGTPIPRDVGWEETVKGFLHLGMTLDALNSFIGVAMTATARRRVPLSDVWRYFCGCCWNEVNTLQSIAFRYLHVLDEGDTP